MKQSDIRLGIYLAGVLAGYIVGGHLSAMFVAVVNVMIEVTIE